MEGTTGHGIATCRDAALEIEHEEVRLADDLDQFRGQQHVPWVLGEAGGYAAAKHGVACESEFHETKPCSP